MWDSAHLSIEILGCSIDISVRTGDSPNKITLRFNRKDINGGPPIIVGPDYERQAIPTAIIRYRIGDICAHHIGAIGAVEGDGHAGRGLASIQVWPS